MPHATTGPRIGHCGKRFQQTSGTVLNGQTGRCDGYQSGQGCLALTVRGSGPPQVMAVDAETGSVRVPMSLVVEADAITGYEGMPADCQLGPISGTLVAGDYAAVSGTATLVALDRPLAPTTACGEYDELFNSMLGLPGVVDTILFARITLPPS